QARTRQRRQSQLRPRGEESGAQSRPARRADRAGGGRASRAGGGARRPASMVEPRPRRTGGSAPRRREAGGRQAQRAVGGGRSRRQRNGRLSLTTVPLPGARVMLRTLTFSGFRAGEVSSARSRIARKTIRISY